jgi:hypothetical protein
MRELYVYAVFGELNSNSDVVAALGLFYGKGRFSSHACI